MLNDKEKGELEAWYNKFCYEHKIATDLYDIHAKIDSNISRWENQRILEEDLKMLAENGTLFAENLKRNKAEHERELKENEVKQHIKLNDLFDKPKIISIVADVNEGKSMTLYYLIDYLKKNFEFNLYSYGLRVNLGEQKVYSIEEIEQIENSVLVVDEYFSLFDLEDRKQRKQIEKTLRHINHNNNILILAGVPENFKKFISSKTEVCFFKKCALNDFVNGSRIKNIAMNYKGNELGSAVLDIPIDKVLIWDGQHYDTLVVPYLSQYDTKKDNKTILKCAKSVPNNVENRNIGLSLIFGDK